MFPGKGEKREMLRQATICEYQKTITEIKLEQNIDEYVVTHWYKYSSIFCFNLISVIVF